MNAERIRPYQLACLVCRAGREEPASEDDRVARLARMIHDHPETPLSLCCNIGDSYAFQDPGLAEDTPEGFEFNRKRDLDLLQRLDLPPGVTLPARILLRKLLFGVETVRGLCGYEQVTGPAWEGCPRAGSGDYERGHARGVEAHIPPRPAEDMQADKERSIAALDAADTVRIRPHIVVCSLCQYGGGTRPPFPEDNLPEFVQMVLEGKDVQVELAMGADWDMCAPCPNRGAGHNICLVGRFSSGGLYNEVKDLNVLQAIGLTYGAILPARALFRLILERMPTTKDVCALTMVDSPVQSVWKDGCSSMVFPGPYEQARAELWEFFECEGTP